MLIKQKLLEVIKESEPIISRDLAIRFILLIGSQVTGKRGPMSDVDLAIYVDPEEYGNRAFHVHVEVGLLLSRKLKRDDIDIVILNDAPPTLRFGAIKNGHILYIKDESEYEDYVVRTLSEYYDSSYFLNRQFQYARTALQGDSE
jgi:predicted nucleotidyltransferase